MVQLARLDTEKNIKTTEAKYRMGVYERSVAARTGLYELLLLSIICRTILKLIKSHFPGLLRNNPALNNVHNIPLIRHFENDQLDKALERSEEIRDINKKIIEIEKRVRENWHK